MTTSSEAVAMALQKVHKNKRELADELNMSKYAMYNKFYRNSWSASDLATVADKLGARLALVFPDGQHINIDAVPDAED